MNGIAVPEARSNGGGLERRHMGFKQQQWKKNQQNGSATYQHDMQDRGILIQHLSSFIFIYFDHFGICSMYT